MSTKTSTSPARRIATIVAALGVLMASCGAALLLTATPANAAADKYFVCKYVGTPGVDETLQTGQNPISTAASSIKEDPIVVGSFFADDQGQSYVLAVDDTPPGPAGDPPVSECPPPNAPTVISVDVVFTDPSCDNDNTASYEVTGDTDNVVVDESAAPAPDTEVTVTATANEGFVFDGGESTFSETHTFGSAADCSSIPPEPPVVVPPVVKPPVATPTIVHAGLIGSTPGADLRSEQGMALLAAGLLLMLVAGGIALPRGARR